MFDIRYDRLLIWLNVIHHFRLYRFAIFRFLWGLAPAIVIRRLLRIPILIQTHILPWVRLLLISEERSCLFNRILWCILRNWRFLVRFWSIIIFRIKWCEERFQFFFIRFALTRLLFRRFDFIDLFDRLQLFHAIWKYSQRRLGFFLLDVVNNLSFQWRSCQSC